MISGRFSNRKSHDAPFDDDGAPSDADVLREAVEALPTRHELAEAIAALDEQSTLRAKNLRQLVVIGMILQTAILGTLIVVL